MNSTTIYIVSNVCPCRLCKGTDRVLNETEKSLFNAHHLKCLETGGRKPYWIFYNPDFITAVGFSAANNPDIDIDLTTMTEVLTVATSVHGCNKIRRNQSTTFYTYKHDDIKVDIIHTRVST